MVITGAGGYLGLNLCTNLAGQCKLRCLTRKRDPLVSAIGGVDAVEVLEGDLLDSNFLNTAFAGVDTVVHLAGLTHDPNPNQYSLLRTNIYATWAILEAARAQGVTHLVFPSTYHVYGRLRSLAPGPVDETQPFQPASIYAASKATAEELIQHSSVPSTILRLSHVFGVGVGHGDRGGVLLTMIRSALADALITLDDGAADVRDYVHVSDVVACIGNIVQNGATACGVYNVGSGRSVTLKGMAEMIAASVGHVRGARVEVVVPASLAFSQRHAYLDINMIREAVAFSPRVLHEEAIDEMVQGERCLR